MSARVVGPQVTEVRDVSGLASPPGAVAAGVCQRAGGAGGVGIGGDLAGATWRARQQPDRFGLAGYDQDERLGDGGGARHGDQVGDGGARGKRQDRVHALVGRDLLQAAAEGVGCDGRCGIDRAGDSRARWQQLAKLVLDLAFERRDVQACIGASVGGQHSGTAGVGHDGDPAPGGHGLACQQRSRIEQLAEVAGGDDASLCEQRLAGDQWREGRCGV
jgi:hypothetical protein